MESPISLQGQDAEDTARAEVEQMLVQTQALLNDIGREREASAAKRRHRANSRERAHANLMETRRILTDIEARR